MHRTINQTRRRRGTAYVLVLGITTLLVTLGLTATHVARGELEMNSLEQNQAQSRIAAQSLLDVIHKTLDGDTAWRAEATDQSWNFFGVYDGASVFYAFEDQIDGDVANDPTQPFLLYALAVSGQTLRIYRVELIPDAAGNLRRNDATFEQGVFN